MALATETYRAGRQFKVNIKQTEFSKMSNSFPYVNNNNNNIIINNGYNMLISSDRALRLSFSIS
jgi:hypothetical protein